MKNALYSDKLFFKIKEITVNSVNNYLDKLPEETIDKDETRTILTGSFLLVMMRDANREKGEIENYKEGLKNSGLGKKEITLYKRYEGFIRTNFYKELDLAVDAYRLLSLDRPVREIIKYLDEQTKKNKSND